MITALNGSGSDKHEAEQGAAPDRLCPEGARFARRSSSLRFRRRVSLVVLSLRAA